jgi:periplasmic protein TonB
LTQPLMENPPVQAPTPPVKEQKPVVSSEKADLKAIVPELPFYRAILGSFLLHGIAPIVLALLFMLIGWILSAWFNVPLIGGGILGQGNMSQGNPSASSKEITFNLATGPLKQPKTQQQQEQPVVQPEETLIEKNIPKIPAAINVPEKTLRQKLPEKPSLKKLPKISKSERPLEKSLETASQKNLPSAETPIELSAPSGVPEGTNTQGNASNNGFPSEGELQEMFSDYMKMLQERLRNAWSPPRGQQNDYAIVRFEIGRDGQLLSSAIEKSSGNVALDAAALNTLTHSAPFDKLPLSYPGDRIPVLFRFDYTILGNPRSGSPP